MSDEVPKLPRGKVFGRWFWADIFRIAFLVLMLAALIAMKDQCSEGVANFVGSFSPTDAGTATTPPPGYELLTPERAKELFPDDQAVDAGGP